MGLSGRVAMAGKASEDPQDSGVSVEPTPTHRNHDLIHFGMRQ